MGRPTDWQSQREKVAEHGESQFVTMLKGEVALRFIADGERKGLTATNLLAGIVEAHYRLPSDIVSKVIAAICRRTGQTEKELIDELVMTAGVAKLQNLESIRPVLVAPQPAASPSDSSGARA